MFTVSMHTPVKKNAAFNPAFKGDMNAVRYVIVDGHVTDDKKVMEDVTKQLVKSLRYCNEDNVELRRSVKKAIPEYYWLNGYQETKFLKLNMLGKEFNIIVGNSAQKLKFIWEQAGVSLAEKKRQASDVVKRLIYDKTSKHIAINAVSETIKGKVKYIIKNIFVTL